MDDLVDQLERVLGGQSESDQGDVWMFPCSGGTDRSDVDLARHHIVPKAGNHLCEQIEAVASLVRDEDAEPLRIFHYRRRPCFMPRLLFGA